jgi:hypothetical protein
MAPAIEDEQEVTVQKSSTRDTVVKVKLELFQKAIDVGEGQRVNSGDFFRKLEKAARLCRVARRTLLIGLDRLMLLRSYDC